MFLSVGGALYLENIVREKVKTQNFASSLLSIETPDLSPRSIKQPRPKSVSVNSSVTLKTDTDTKISLFPKFEKTPEEKKIPKAEDKISYLVIIVDDLGGNTFGTNEILSLNHPLTLAVIPYLSRSREVAEKAHQKGFEVIVHLPLEAEDETNNKKNPPIMVDMLDSEIQEKTKSAFASVPYAVGFNNHQGSKFTTSISAMRNILKVAKEQGFFYIDSLTSPYTIGELAAKGVGVKFGKRDIFLDNVKNKNYIKEQFGQLINIAKRKGSAVGICHVSLLTYEVLREELPKLEEQNIKLVFASEVVK